MSRKKKKRRFKGIATILVSFRLSFDSIFQSLLEYFVTCIRSKKLNQNLENAVGFLWCCTFTPPISTWRRMKKKDFQGEICYREVFYKSIVILLFEDWTTMNSIVFQSKRSKLLSFWWFVSLCTLCSLLVYKGKHHVIWFPVNTRAKKENCKHPLRWRFYFSWFSQKDW